MKPFDIEASETPRTDSVIAKVMERFPGASARKNAEYYEAVHQELAPLAREMERELASARKKDMA